MAIQKRRWIILIYAFVILGSVPACRTMSHLPTDSWQQSIHPIYHPKRAQEALRLSYESKNERMKRYFLLELAQMLLSPAHLKEAHEVLSHTDCSTCTPTEKQMFDLNLAQYHLLNHQPQSTLSTLAQLKPSTLGKLHAERYHQLLTQALSALDHWASMIQSQSHDVSISHDLAHASINSLKKQYHQTKDPRSLAWLSLAITNYYLRYHPHQVTSKLKSLLQYHKHLGQDLQIDEKTLEHKKINRVTLMLPHHGSKSNIGLAIEQGFLLTHFWLAKQQSRLDMRIALIDAPDISGDLFDTYRHAQNNNPDWIVTMLSKEHSSDLIRLADRSIDHLILNPNPQGHIQQHHMTFLHLSPSIEASALARHVRKLGYSAAVLIDNQTQWSQAASQAFKSQWAQLNGTIAQQLTIHGHQNINAAVQQALGIVQSRQRARHISTLLRQHLRFIPRRRQDIDVIILLTSAQSARQIVPTLHYNFANLPIYGTSSLWDRQIKTKGNKDLNGLHFCQSQWLMPNEDGHLDTVKKMIMKQWPKKFQHYSRFFALGVDARLFLEYQDYLSHLPFSQFLGATGTLDMQNGQIHRQMPCYHITHGRLNRSKGMTIQSSL